MHLEEVEFKSKAWGVVPYPGKPGHFYTGYDGSWERGMPNLNGTGATPEEIRQSWLASRRDWVATHGAAPKAAMQIGKNVIIRDARFKIVSYGRGRSAANFYGHFSADPSVQYEMGMQGMMDTLTHIQSGRFPIVDGYVTGGVWTFAKQGANFFLRPVD